MKTRRTHNSTHTTVQAGRIRFSAFRVVVLLICLIAPGIGIALLPGEFQRVDASVLARESKVSQDGLWTNVDETLLKLSQAGRTLPQSYRMAQLNQDALMRAMNQAPMEFTEQAGELEVLMTLPMPDRTFSKFRIEESPILAPKLAASYPQFKTYQGQGVDDPEATMRFDWTPAGFHAIIFSADGTVYVDPYSNDNTDYYITYYKADDQREAEPFNCRVSEAKPPQTASPVQSGQGLVTGWSRRNYRLALAATHKYTSEFRKFGDSDADARIRAFNEIVITMNRVNGIFLRELGIFMTLVDREMEIIYANVNEDPYTGASLETENQENLDNVLLPSNYDIGHVFSISGGGGSWQGGVCIDGWKGGGATGHAPLTGDSHDVGYVAHEMGHQFGASHTYNYDGGQRVESAAYEPSGGSTIMGYGNLISTPYLQARSDDYFHSKSLEEIIAHINTTPPCTEGCGACIPPPPPNRTPWVSTTPRLVIPKGTPFSLVASGGDPDGDPVTYCWEQYDLGPASPPDTDADGLLRPIFRSFKPKSSNSRTFPQMSDILNNTPTFGESLPTFAHTMNFQVTVRDNRGGLASAMTQVDVASYAGPFFVTSPNTDMVVWPVNTTQVVNWNVAGTNVIASKVTILLSIDGGDSFPIILAPGVSNTGVALVAIPNTPTNKARIKVEAEGRNFFDISNADFKIANFQGYLDSANCDTVSGWAWNSAQPDTPINVEIYDGPYLAGTVTANQFRQDLFNAGIGNGFHSYTFTFPYRLRDRQTNSISIKFSGTSINLANSPRSVACGIQFQGYLDAANCDIIGGWAWDVNRPTTAVNVDIYDNGYLLTTVPANLFRPDLAPAGIGNGYHAFHLPLPSRLKDGRSHSISAMISGLSIGLTNSPRRILCSP